MKHKYAKNIILLLIAVLSLLAAGGCSDKGDEEDNRGFYLYYINREGTRLETEEYEVEADDINEQVSEIWQELRKDKGTMASAIPSGVDIIWCSVSNNVLSINFGSYYSSLDSISEIFLRASLVLTLTQLDGIDYVSFYVEDQPLKDSSGSTVGMMKASNFIGKVGNSINNYETTTVTLYFANIKGNALKTEMRTGIYDSSQSLERYIVEQIIEGPGVDGNYKTIPEKTSIRSINTSNGICYIDFTREFLESASSVKDEIMIYSIVNSLTELSYINKVQISVEGEVDIMLHNQLSLNTLFMRDLGYMEQ